VQDQTSSQAKGGYGDKLRVYFIPGKARVVKQTEAVTEGVNMNAAFIMSRDTAKWGRGYIKEEVV
jgi:hypothetical protein